MEVYSRNLSHAFSSKAYEGTYGTITNTKRPKLRNGLRERNKSTKTFPKNSVFHSSLASFGQKSSVTDFFGNHPQQNKYGGLFILYK